MPARAVPRRRRGRRQPRLGPGDGGGGVNYTWYVERAGGTLAFVLLTGSVVLGLLLSNKASLRRWPRFALEDVHRFVGILAGAFIAIHVAALLVDNYLPFSLA